MLDTNALLWWVLSDDRLTQMTRDIIASPANSVFVSVASIWEIAIKSSIGKLRLTDSAETLLPPALRDGGLELLQIQLEHALGVEALPFHHNDPFDRLLIAQAKVEGLALLTSDTKLQQYDVTVIPA